MYFVSLFNTMTFAASENSNNFNVSQNQENKLISYAKSFFDNITPINLHQSIAKLGSYQLNPATATVLLVAGMIVIIYVFTPKQLSKEKIMQEATKQFEHVHLLHPLIDQQVLKQAILSEIESRLSHYHQYNIVTFGRMRYSGSTEQMELYRIVEYALQSFFERKDLFPNISIARLGGGCFTLDSTMPKYARIAHECFEKRKWNVLNIHTKKNIELLHLIRNTLYTIHFAENPKFFIKEMKERCRQKETNLPLLQEFFHFFDYAENKLEQTQ